MKIILKNIFIITLFAFSIPVFADLKPTAVFRADFFGTISSSNIRQAGILDTRLKLDSQSDLWRFKADADLAFYSGFITNLSGKMSGKLISAFIKYSPTPGSFTIGKAYLKLGLLSLFNPFEWDKQINLSDITAEKEGVVQVAFENSGSGLSQFKIVLAPEDSPDKTAGALQYILSSKIGETGIVLSRKQKNMNTTGLFFKGDLLLGWNASFACHFEDNIQNNHNEASLGADYSFFEGELIFSLLGYWTEQGASHRYDQVQNSDDRYLLARSYGYGNVRWSPDQFMSYKMDLFWNTTDNSMIIIPSASVILANGLTLSALLAFPTGTSIDEFSRTQSGIVTLDLRLEAKM